MSPRLTKGVDKGAAPVEIEKVGHVTQPYEHGTKSAFEFQVGWFFSDVRSEDVAFCSVRSPICGAKDKITPGTVSESDKKDRFSVLATAHFIRGGIG